MAAAPYVHPGTGATLDREVGEHLSGYPGHQGVASELESAFADFVGARHAVALSSGSAALHLALLAHGVRPGDKVVVSPLCPPAVIAAILAVQAQPVYADINQYTYTMDPLVVDYALNRSAEATVPEFCVTRSASGEQPPGPTITHPSTAGQRHESSVGSQHRTQNPESRTSASGWPTQNAGHRVAAMVAVALFGQPCDMTALLDLAGRHGLALIQVAWEALGATLGGEQIGAFGTAVYSFQRDMAICTGEGGMLTTNAPDIAENVRRLANNGCDCHGRICGPGFNYRMPEVVACLALGQLSHVETRLTLQRMHAEELTHGLTGVPGLLPPHVLPGAEHAFQRYGLRITPEFPFSVRQVCRQLRERGIRASRCHVLPPHQHPVHRAGVGPASVTPLADTVGRELLFLPVGPDLQDDECRAMSHALRLMATSVMED